MPLILAIEPDRRQASRVTALARGTLSAELLVADSTERGVAVLDGRVPDLILTSRLLSPRDEAGLHAIDRAGVPVPTLMIPVLAGSSSSQQERGGLLKRLPWGRSGSSSSPADSDGCDPEVFASQIAEYLLSVQEERARVHEVHGVHKVHAVPEAHAVPEVHTVHAVQAYEASALASLNDAYVDPGTRVDTVIMAAPETFEQPEAPATPEFAASVFAASEIIATPLVATPFQETPVVEEPVAESSYETVDLSESLVAESASDVEPEVFAEDAAEPVFVAEDVVADAERVTLTDMVTTPSPVAAAATSEHTPESPEWDDILLEEFDDAAIELSGEAIDLRAFVEALEASSGETSAPLRIVPPRAHAPEPAFADPVFAEPAFVATPPPVRPVLSVPRFAVANALPTHAAWPTLQGISAEEAPLAGMTEIVADFAAALIAAEDEPDSPCPDDADSDLWMPLSAAATLAWPRLDSSCSTTNRRAQDEWGFFDPEQCGFSALVAKLDQMGR
jgi:hypothetical protein